MSFISKRSRFVAAVGLASVALVISGCSGGAPGDDGTGGGGADGPSVEFGADAATWQAAFDEAFAEREPIEIAWNTSNSAVSFGGKGVQAIADQIEEYSNGHVSVEVAFQDSIAPFTETFLALQDGRLSVSNIGTFVRPEEFPIMGVIGHEATVTRGPSVVADSLSSYAAFIETFWDTPEMVAEYEDKGLVVLNPESVFGQNVITCSEPWTSLDDLKGKQIRVASQIQSKQIEALGAAPVSVPYAEIYESLQRGIVDCLVFSMYGMTDFPGMTQFAPYIMNPEGAAFGINTNSYLAGAESWESWPLVLRQLVFDLQAQDDMRQLGTITTRAELQLDEAEAAGGGFLELDQDVNDALKAVNDEMIAGWSDSPLLDDGDDFRERLFANLEKWHQRVLELGYSDAPFSDTDAWLDPDLDLTSFADIFYEYITLPHRPS